MNQSLRALADIAVTAALVTACATSTSPTATGAPGSSQQAVATPKVTATPNAAHMIATVAVPANPNGMLYAYGSVWVTSRHSNSVFRIDPATASVSATINVGDEPAYFVDDGTALWVVDYAQSAMSRIDPTTNASELVTFSGAPGGQPAFGHGTVWQATSDGTIGIDVKTRAVSQPITGGPSGVAFGGGYLLIAVNDGPGIRRVDPTTLKDHDVLAPAVDAEVGLFVDGTTLWAASASGVDRLDLDTGKVLGSYTTPPGVDPGMSVATGGRLWLQRGYPDGFAMIDPASTEPGAFQLLPGPVTESLYFASVSPHELWVSDWDANVVYEIDPAP